MSPQVKKLKEKYITSNVTPIWLLIYWRLVNQTPNLDYANAYLQLSDNLPKNVAMPTIDEIAVNLALHRLV